MSGKDFIPDLPPMQADHVLRPVEAGRQLLRDQECRRHGEDDYDNG